jgi:hypothetical protein
MSAKEGDDSTGQARVMRCWAIPHVKQTLETHNDIKLRMMSGWVAFGYLLDRSQKLWQNAPWAACLLASSSLAACHLPRVTVPLVMKSLAFIVVLLQYCKSIVTHNLHRS